MVACPDNTEIQKTATAMAWCWPVKDVLADKNFYLRLVIQYGGLEYLKIAQKYFTKDDFVEAIETAPPGFFYSTTWYSWRKKLGLPLKKMPVRFPQFDNDIEDWWRGGEFAKKTKQRDRENF